MRTTRPMTGLSSAGTVSPKPNRGDGPAPRPTPTPSARQNAHQYLTLRHARPTLRLANGSHWPKSTPPRGEPPTRMRMAAVLFACGCVFFPTLFHLLRRFLDRTCRDRLSVATTCSISVRCVSSIQAVMACVSGVIIITSCKDIMHDQHPLTEAYAYFGFPYFYYDTWAMFTAHCYNNPHLRHLSTWAAIKHFVLCHKMMMGHHLILPPVFFLVVSVMRQNQGDFFIGCFYLFEIPIPFISAYKILVLLKMQESPLYIITGVAMIIAFTLSRVCIFPYLYWSYGQYRNMAIFDVLFTIPIKCNIGCLVLLFPQLYWLYLMIQGTRKVLSKKMYLTPSGRK